MSWKREGANVIITLTEQDYQMLLIALGMATARCPESWLIRLVNTINEGNPHFTPYQVSGEPR